MKLLGDRNMGILIFLLLWFFISFVIWYLSHVLNVINEGKYTDESFVSCFCLLPVSLLMFLVKLYDALNSSTIGDRIKARLDKFFGI